jgi:hypothetical protein
MFMYTSAIRNKNNNLSNHAAAFMGFLLLLISSVGLVGCNSSSSTPAPLPDQDASGLYKNGTGNLNSGASMPTDLIGMIHANRFIIFSVSAHILLDGTMTAPVKNDFTATADVYENGVKTQTGISITGQVTTKSSFAATLSGTGLASGTIDLLYDPLYTVGATFARIEATGFNTWSNAPSYSVNDTILRLGFDSLGIYSGGNSQNPSCSYDNGVTTIPSNQINIYQLTNDITESNSCAIIGNGYTGFGSVIDTNSTDDTFLYAVTNGINSVFAILTK